MLDCIVAEDKLIDYAIELGLDGVAITDHEALGGHLKALKHFEKLKKKSKNILLETEKFSDEEVFWAKKVENFKLGLGNEIYLCRDNLSLTNYVKGEDGFFHFILMAKNNKGHRQIRELSSRAWSHSFRQFIERVPTYYSDIEEIIGNDKGNIVATTACLGGFFPKLLNTAYENNDFSKVGNFVAWCESIFGEDFFIEIQPGLSEEQITFNTRAVEYCKQNNLNFIVATDTHYLKREDRAIHKSFLNSSEGDREVDSFYAYTYLMDENEVLNKLKSHLSKEDATKAIENTKKIYNSVESYNFFKKQVIPKVPYSWEGLKKYEKIENYEWINTFLKSEYDCDVFYINKIIEGLKNKNIYDEKHLSRVDIELEQIWKLSEIQNERLSYYFLTMSKILDLIWEESIVGPGRGSVFTHLCSYALDIIQGDPLDSPIELPYWRFLSYERPELPDIDTDFEASKRNLVVTKIKNYFRSIGGDLIPVCTYGTETSKAALQTAARGLGYEPEVGTYLSSLIPIDRGFVRTLKQCYYGDEEKDYIPVKAFVTEMNNYKDVWEVAQTIEGLISHRGRHACGVLPTNGNFYDYNATMKAPDGEITSQFELHDSEEMGLIKYDFLTTDFLDRIHVCMDLLVNNKKIDWQGNLRDTYNKYLYPNTLEYQEPEMWNMVSDNKIIALFQFDTPVGLQTVKQIKPTSLAELAQSNSLMRLMPEAGKETPTEEYIKYKNNISLFYQEIDNLNATEKEKNALIEILRPLYGIADGQEAAMRLLMHPDLFNFSIKEGHGARKLIAKKKIKEISDYRKMLFEKAKEIGLSNDVVHYIWDVQIGRQLGYSFSYPHTVAYSIVAIQAMNLAYFYPSVYWNTACLIVDSDGIDGFNLFLGDMDSEIEDDESDESDVDSDENEENSKTNKKKVVKYGKISSAIGKMKSLGINIVPPNINKSNFTFSPDEENNRIIYGIKGITKINADTTERIISSRPYSSMEDFLNKVKVTKVQMINLIKSGAFDEIEKHDRKQIMFDYIKSISGCKSKLTLQNMPTIIKMGMIPDDLKQYEKLFNFNKFLKKCKNGTNYELDDICQEYFNENFDNDVLSFEDDSCFINQKAWDKIYKKEIEKIRPFILKEETLKKFNDKLIEEIWQKYCTGSIPKWEMDSIGFYNGVHELDGVNEEKYDIENFFSLPEEPIIEKSFITEDKKTINMYKLTRIAGTVIEKNKLKNIVTILTTDGVVKVKIFKPQFVKYDKRLFEKDFETGKKKIIEESWFTRGNKIVFHGMRRGDNFIPKVYKNSKYSNPIGLIEEIDYLTGDMKICYNRREME